MYKESFVQYTKNTRTKYEEKTVFTDHLDTEKFIHTMDHLYDQHCKPLGLKDK